MARMWCCVLCCVLVLSLFCAPTHSTKHVDTEHKEARLFMQKIFDKYGDNGAMTFDGFEHLLVSLGIGNLKINDHDIHDHFLQGGFVDLHDDHNHLDISENVTSSGNTSSDDVIEPPVDSPSQGHTNGDSKRRRRAMQRAAGTSQEDQTHSGEKCMSAPEILSTFHIPSDKPLTENNFLHICPAIIYQIDKHSCQNTPCDDIHDDIDSHLKSYHLDDDHHHNDTVTKKRISFWQISGKTWGFALLSVTVISLVGLMCVAIIPIMQKLFFDHLIQFLVALAIGSLTGDALLHLIPHSMIPHTEASHDHGEDEGSAVHQDAVYKGLAVLGGAYAFFIAERAIGFLSQYREHRRAHKKKELISEVGDFDVRYNRYSQIEVSIGEKLSRHNRLSFYDVISTVHPTDDSAENPHEELQQLREAGATQLTHIEEDRKHADTGHDIEFEVEHKGHGHGHSHDVPSSVSSLAWMVIMGDGLHNFCDGMAIGAAFASSLTGGVSTSVAVFCHELPHELGDFAVLLRAGMSPKQALFYNLVSSVLCFLGMLVGLLAGNLENADSWIFALAGGMFIYISLVNMLPEISSTQSGPNSCCYLLLHCLGISTGIAIMLVIALYEDKISLGLGDDAL